MAAALEGLYVNIINICFHHWIIRLALPYAPHLFGCTATLLESAIRLFYPSLAVAKTHGIKSVPNCTLIAVICLE
jgi:hypothetical protein